MEKLVFALEHENDWPPVSSEGVWCERVGENYRLLNAPCFIKGLANQDVFEAKLDDVNGQIFDFTVIKESGHSLVWALNTSDSDTTALQNRFRKLGCNIVEVKQFSLLCIDIPIGADRAGVDVLLDESEESGLDLAIPVWRHEIDSA
jgi:hypothetical protein